MEVPLYSQIHLIGILLIEIPGSDQDFSPDNHCYDRQVMTYQVKLTGFRLSEFDCI